MDTHTITATIIFTTLLLISIYSLYKFKNYLEENVEFSD